MRKLRGLVVKENTKDNILNLLVTASLLLLLVSLIKSRVSKPVVPANSYSGVVWQQTAAPPKLTFYQEVKPLEPPKNEITAKMISQTNSSGDENTTRIFNNSSNQNTNSDTFFKSASKPSIKLTNEQVAQPTFIKQTLKPLQQILPNVINL